MQDEIILQAEVESMERIDSDIAGLESDSIHVIRFIDGFESIALQLADSGKVALSGCESYTIGVLKANDIKFSPYMGSENFIIEGAKKLYEMITALCKNIWNFFFGKGDDTTPVKDDLAVIAEDENKVDKATKIKSKKELVDTEIVLSKNDHIDIIKAPQRALDKANDEARRPVKNKSDKIKKQRAETISAVAKQALEDTRLAALRSNAQLNIAAAVDKQIGNLNYEDITVERNIADEIGRKDSVAIGALKAIKKKYDEYIGVVEANKENLFSDIGQWSGHYQAYRELKEGVTNRAITTLLQIGTDGHELEAALARDVKSLEKRKELLKSRNVREEDRKDISAASRVIRLEANLLAMIKGSLRKLQKVQATQLIKIEQAKSAIIVKCVLLEDRKEIRGRI